MKKIIIDTHTRGIKYDAGEDIYFIDSSVQYDEYDVFNSSGNIITDFNLDIRIPLRCNNITAYNINGDKLKANSINCKNYVTCKDLEVSSIDANYINVQQNFTADNVNIELYLHVLGTVVVGNLNIRNENYNLRDIKAGSISLNKYKLESDYVEIDKAYCINSLISARKFIKIYEGYIKSVVCTLLIVKNNLQADNVSVDTLDIENNSKVYTYKLLVSKDLDNNGKVFINNLEITKYIYVMIDGIVCIITNIGISMDNSVFFEYDFLKKLSKAKLNDAVKYYMYEWWKTNKKFILAVAGKI